MMTLPGVNRSYIPASLRRDCGVTQEALFPYGGCRRRP